jgi:radical SAM superfamily enzyme YgiQ (UPF0313 family)
MNDVLMIYPILGTMDAMVMDIPLSVIYASAHVVKKGYDVQILDLRCHRTHWKEVLRGHLRKQYKLVGISVMTGSPLRNAVEVSRIIRAESPATKIVWGGPHPTVLPETVENPYIDYTIRGYGSEPLLKLIEALHADEEDLSRIESLSYKKDGKIFHNKRPDRFEMLDFHDIPYDLVDITSPDYARGFSGEILFPVFSAIGCPYKCAFCISPATYTVINGPKWMPYDTQEVLAHIEYGIKRYGAKHICIMDDTCFPDLERMRRIFQLIIERELNITLEFRGARVNELDRMDDAFLEILVRAGGRMLMVGFESGSDRVLEIMKKGISKDQIIRVNRKLARYPELVPHYNLIYGVPGERYEDLLETKETVLQLVRDNPNCYIGFGSDWKPIPGSTLVDVAVKEFHYRPPITIEEWIEMDSSDAKKIVHSWYSRKHNALIKLMQISSFVIDDKILKSSRNNTSIVFTMLRVSSRMYKPIAMMRLRYNIHQLLIEYYLWRFLLWVLRSWKKTEDLFREKAAVIDE